MPVVRAVISVLMRRATEFGDADKHDIAHPIPHVLMKCRDALPQIAQQIRELALNTSFIHVMIPAAAVEEGDL